MIHVYQDVFGHPDGNCGSAVIASILELPLRDVPPFKGDDGLWFVKLKQWLNERGLEPEPHARSVLPVDSYVYVSGMGGRGLRHSCVWWGGPAGIIVHDPHPLGGGLVEDDPDNPLWWCVIERLPGPRPPPEIVLHPA